LGKARRENYLSIISFSGGCEMSLIYVIAQPCIDVKDKACVDVCPVDCIHGDEDSPQMYINPDECIGCGACEVECPVEAIFLDSDLPEQWKHYEKINAEFFV